MWIKFVVVKIVLLMLKYRNAVSYIFENLTLLILMYFIKFCSSTSDCMAAECCAQSICSFTVWSIFQIGFTKNMIESICGYENDLFPTTVTCTKDISFDNLVYPTGYQTTVLSCRNNLQKFLILNMLWVKKIL